MKKNEESASTSKHEYDIISSEIEKAVDMSIESDRQKKAEGSEEPAIEAVETPTPAAEEPAAAFEVGDAEIERAVKAGLSIADARAFKDRDAFERVMSRLEGKGDQPKEGISKADGEGDEDRVDDSPEDDIPTLPEDEDYDPKLVDAFKRMGAMLKASMKEVRALKKAGKSAEETSFFDSQFNGLDETVRSRVDEAGRAQLRKKFDVLERGYGKDSGLSREDIFKEAAELALGSIMREAGAAGKAARIAERSSLRLARPGSENGRPARKSEEDVDREVARLISEKFDI